MWLGYRLLSVDGTKAVLPNHPSIKSEFGVINYGPNVDSPRSLANVSMLYDVLNLLTLDVELGNYETSEKELLQKHLNRVESGKDLLL